MQPDDRGALSVLRATAAGNGVARWQVLHLPGPGENQGGATGHQECGQTSAAGLLPWSVGWCGRKGIEERGVAVGGGGGGGVWFCCWVTGMGMFSTNIMLIVMMLCDPYCGNM